MAQLRLGLQRHSFVFDADILLKFNLSIFYFDENTILSWEHLL